MATLEGSGPCSLSEYEAWEPYRLQADVLRAGELYMYMMKLRREVHGFRAAKQIARIISVSPFDGESDMRVVHIAFTDDRGIQLEDLNGKIALRSGLLDYPASVLLDESLAKTVIASGYFRGSAELANDPFMEIFTERQVPVAA